MNSRLLAIVMQYGKQSAKWLPLIALIALFGFAATDKLTHFLGFVLAIHSYKLLPVSIEITAAVFIIASEFLVAVGLLFHNWRRLSALLSLTLLSTFTIVYLIAAPEDLCGCWFSFTLSKGGPWHVIQNTLFAGLALFVWLDSREDVSAPLPAL
jgi:methylamine utilization protein MauE